MKKLAFLFLFSIAGFLSYGQRFKSGLVAGVPTSQVSGDNLSGFDKAGIMFGGLVSTKLGEKFSVEAELLYFQKGSKTKANAPTFYKMSLGYLELPMLFQYHAKKLVVEGGPSIGFLISSSEEDLYGDIPGQKPFNLVETSFNLGLNYPIYQKFRMILRYNQSITPIRPHASGETRFLNAGQYNTVLLFGLQYIFDPTNDN